MDAGGSVGEMGWEGYGEHYELIGDVCGVKGVEDVAVEWHCYTHFVEMFGMVWGAEEILAYGGCESGEEEIVDGER